MATIRRLLLAAASESIVDVGAGDGVSESVSREFVISGWRALLIESRPAGYARLSEVSAGIGTARCSNGRAHGSGGTWDLVRRLLAQDRTTKTTPDKLLTEAEWPAEFGVLHSNRSVPAAAVFNDLSLERFRPDLIACADDERTPQRRGVKYRRLVMSSCGSTRCCFPIQGGSPALLRLSGSLKPKPRPPGGGRSSTAYISMCGGSKISWKCCCSPATIFRFLRNRHHDG